ncbi:uncharacterized protein LOC119834691 isoform X2 [Zerene cesonia]|uniref:uncharacterized protein LOC119834691 isoform X2 n=1 Tax=Zerene cesonia TaxID=33412 RepID=UPI0018E54195|nr:uncharacterized protein LOC119834691 isoform X2 [Zerene cesonia]
MRLIILLGLLIGVLYCIHILVKDYQAISAARVFRLIFKRDLNSVRHKINVRWGRILHYDTIQCTRYIFCDLGMRPPNSQLREDFIQMLTLEPKEEDVAALDIFKNAYHDGKLAGETKKADRCRTKYPMCPFKIEFLYEVIQYLVQFH